MTIEVLSSHFIKPALCNTDSFDPGIQTSLRNCAGAEDGGIHVVRESTEEKPRSLLWVHELDVPRPDSRSAILRGSSHSGALITTMFLRE